MTFFYWSAVLRRNIRRFEWIFRQFKEEVRRLNSAKSSLVTQKRRSDAPKLRTQEFLRHTLAAFRLS